MTARGRAHASLSLAGVIGPGLLAVGLLAGCPRPVPLTPTGPSTGGMSYSDYLASARDEPPAPTRPEDTDTSESMTYHFIDVGQGTSILLEFPCGAVLVDTGGEENEDFDSRAPLIKYLDDFFARRTDLKRKPSLLVITHPHLDHDRWVKAVLDRYRVQNVIDDGLSTSTELGADELRLLHAWLTRHPEVGHDEILASDVTAPDGLTNGIIDPIGATCGSSQVDPEIRALWGQETVDRETFGDKPNLHSIVLRVDFGKSSALLPADLEVLGLARMTARFEQNPGILDVDLLQVGHHGSRNATVKHFIRSTTPKIAVIPVGPYERDLDWTARRYGHPNKGVLAMLQDPDGGVSWKRDDRLEVQAGVRGRYKEKMEIFEKALITRAIYATAWDGNVQVKAYANGWLEVTTSR